MDAKLAFWTAALINMAILTGFAVSGVRQARRGEVACHKRSMIISASLVAGFVLSYALKLTLLGREDLDVWSTASIITLRLHELCVFTMVVAGAMALRRGLALRQTRAFSHDESDPVADEDLMKGHRRVGRIALISALLGLTSAAFVLAGMYGRSAL